jgi:hypothetical protein
VIIDHCLFEHNEATDISFYPVPSGGAIALDNSSIMIRNSRFTNNVSVSGGAIICATGSNAEIINNEFSVNTAPDPSGGSQWGQGCGAAITVYDYSNPAIRNNVFHDNIAERHGGAIVCNDNCNPYIDHNLFYYNTADGLGGAIELEVASNPVLINNTISYNQAGFGGGIDVWNDCSPEVRNTILWGNNASVAGTQVNINDASCVPDFYYCDIQGGQAAFGGSPHSGYYENCMDMDPVFEDASLAYYSLMCELSPCKDAGDPDPIYNDPNGSRNDMGAIWPPVYCLGISEVESDGFFIYPNPVQTEVNIEYQIGQPSLIRITLVNQLGQEIMVMPIKGSPAGKQKISINVSTLPQGVYFIKLQKGNEIAARKMIRL